MDHGGSEVIKPPCNVPGIIYTTVAHIFVVYAILLPYIAFFFISQEIDFFLLKPLLETQGRVE